MDKQSGLPFLLLLNGCFCELLEKVETGITWPSRTSSVSHADVRINTHHRGESSPFPRPVQEAQLLIGLTLSIPFPLTFNRTASLLNLPLLHLKNAATLFYFAPVPEKDFSKFSRLVPLSVLLIALLASSIITSVVVFLPSVSLKLPCHM